MADTETPTQRAARLRREKREAKGTDRLSKITNISGRQQDLQPQPAQVSTHDLDPPEIDISRTPPTFTSPGASSIPATANSSEEAQLRAFLRSQQNAADGAQDPFLSLMQQAQQGQQGGAGNNPNGDDPMMQMLQQIFQPPPGTSSPIPGAAGTQGGPPDGLPPGLASLLGGGAGQPAPAPSTSSYIWRIVHAVFSLLLGAYVAFVLPFDGSRSERESPLAQPQSIFWIFATVELGLQSARYMLDKGAGAPSGWVGTVLGFVPQPYGNYLKLAMRYSGYWTTLSEDALVVVFVLGAVAWWKGKVEA